MVKGVGDDEGLEEMKDVAVEMPKHTKRRDTFAGSPPFSSPQDKDFAQAKAARRTEIFAAIPEQGPVDAPTPPKSKSTGVLERAVDSFFESPNKRQGHKPPKRRRWSGGLSLAAKPAAHSPTYKPVSKPAAGSKPAAAPAPAPVGKKPPARFL